ncbi:prepilin-type N-terminal cleavage/methylation domain-containing protein [Candidatus Roizmanbacteria bacterium]|nr:prepilin-type N-terminal cleavage/methylation domain-containing protein [Candidatus Roizmanbacteria bacterium]
MSIKKGPKSSGFSLIEVLIFISVLSVFFVVAAAVTTAALRNLQVSEHRIMATRYAEELADWLRGQKEADWYSFSSVTSGTYCANADPLPGSIAGLTAGFCTVNGLTPAIFHREVTLTPAGQFVNIAIVVSWSELNSTYNYQIPITTQFTQYE